MLEEGCVISRIRNDRKIYMPPLQMWSQNIGLTSQKKIRRISEKAVQRANALRRES